MGVSGAAAVCRARVPIVRTAAAAGTWSSTWVVLQGTTLLALSLQLLRDVMLFHDVLLAEEGDVDGVVLASKLTAAGYRVAVRQALGGGSGVQVFSNLRHSFLLVTAQDCPCAGKDFIVEVRGQAGWLERARARVLPGLFWMYGRASRWYRLGCSAYLETCSAARLC